MFPLSRALGFVFQEGKQDLATRIWRGKDKNGPPLEMDMVE